MFVKFWDINCGINLYANTDRKTNSSQRLTINNKIFKIINLKKEKKERPWTFTPLGYDTPDRYL